MGGVHPAGVLHPVELRPAGFEPAACGLGNRRSIHLSYEREVLTRDSQSWNGLLSTCLRRDPRDSVQRIALTLYRVACMATAPSTARTIEAARSMRHCPRSLFVGIANAGRSGDRWGPGNWSRDHARTGGPRICARGQLSQRRAGGGDGMPRSRKTVDRPERSRSAPTWLTLSRGVDSWTKRSEHHGRVDFWVNNAGVAPGSGRIFWKRHPRAGTVSWTPIFADRSF